ncbi:hypothetical protein Zmor_004386 [Zophobas morio]|uniref:Uncharacterized protein n=1 Tax=Zophobas morio TaxID=2755281 RepID=A0AA38HI93_9CUCU|nr:hypothetical protein Zmor_004386 [Zophobas morio]
MGNTSPNARDTSSDSEPPSAVAPPLRRDNKIPPVVLCEKQKWDHFVKLLLVNDSQKSRDLRQVIKIFPATAGEYRAITKLMGGEALPHFTHQLPEP